MPGIVISPMNPGPDGLGLVWPVGVTVGITSNTTAVDVDEGGAERMIGDGDGAIIVAGELGVTKTITGPWSTVAGVAVGSPASPPDLTEKFSVLTTTPFSATSTL